MTPARVPASTYRLQISQDFDLLEAARTLPYLHELGVDWVYLSPVLASESGSDHGYDVADHSAIDPSRGRASGLSALSSEARRLGMGVLVDVVPNHVGIARPWENAWWWHVLTHGRESPYAGAFDIDWEAGDGRVLVPVVGDDDLRDDGRVSHLELLGGELHYHDQRFPIAPGTFGPEDDDADAVHVRQHYELVSWRRADTDLNYRRFFSVNTLAAIRVEDPEWFARSHEEIARWFEEDLADGLRIDHPDGLRDPGKYLDDLAALTGDSYVLVEKILEPGERLPDSWSTAGTTGYDALALVDRVLTDPAGAEPLGALEDRLRGGPVDWHAMVHDNKRTVADGTLRAETRRIARELATLVEHPAADLEDAVAELLACTPVYRSYLPEGREHVEAAFSAARRHRPDLAALLDELAPVLSDGSAGATQRFQQTSGMVMAKGVEDRAFYRWSRLTSLNEVGGDPSVFAVTPDEFHAAMIERHAGWPHAMVAATTHDTKRGEDVRARIAVLAEVPDTWTRAIEQLHELAPAPDPGFGNLLWQAVVGTWSDDPALRERLHAYAEKAMREAGDRTTWTDPDEAYETAVHGAVDAAFDDDRVRGVVEAVVADVAGPGRDNALAAKLIGLTLPGVPDVYQGSELWEDSLVDPDNRRAVDFDCRSALVAQETLDHPKLALVRAALRLRRDRPDLYTTYQPLEANGRAADHVLAFDRGGAVTVATRLPHGLARLGGWGDTALELPRGRWRDELTGTVVASTGRLAVADLLAELPVALLVAEPAQPGAHSRFDVWAPRASRVRLSVGDAVMGMERGHDDWWRPAEPLGELSEGEVDYGFLLDDDDTPLPDPRSRRQPEGVHGRSRTFDPAGFTWTDEAWHGRPLAGGTIYELHVGTFTPEGTLDAAIDRLDHLRSVGVDFVELMPVNAFNGRHGWGYDGVLWSAVHEPYGGPRAYQRFVDACHAHGLGVIQDVVHNHLGPSGNHLPRFGPYLVEGDTPWGAQVNLDQDGSAEVRRLILDSVRGWFTDFHVDGLRLDAVHALADGSETHLLEEMATETAAWSSYLGKPLFLIAESDLNDPHLITPREAGGYGLDAQWSDDFHHALHVALTAETDGYYADFEPLGALAKVLERGFFHDGTWSSFRGRAHGVPLDVDRVPGWRLVVASQNHDQVGNRARGDRLTETLGEDQLALAALITLTSPFTPMLFMGEEWGASTPFAFFTDHPQADLGRAVSEGRIGEFSRMGWDASTVPDPQDPTTFERSRLDWSERDTPRGQALLACYQRLTRLRRTLPALTDPDLRRTSVDHSEAERWLVLRRGVGRTPPSWSSTCPTRRRRSPWATSLTTSSRSPPLERDMRRGHR